jgi:hypothetical protein
MSVTELTVYDEGGYIQVSPATRRAASVAADATRKELAHACGDLAPGRISLFVLRGSMVKAVKLLSLGDAVSVPGPYIGFRVEGKIHLLVACGPLDAKLAGRLAGAEIGDARWSRPRL